MWLAYLFNSQSEAGGFYGSAHTKAYSTAVNQKGIFMVNNCSNLIRSILFPPHCLLCGAPGNDGMELCLRCRNELPVNRLCCRQCALPLTATANQPRICGACIALPPAFDLCLTPFIYRTPLDSLISGFKFRQNLSNGRLLSQLLLAFLLKQGVEMPDLIIPVPLHRSRITERGFNQSLEIARYLCRQLHLPLNFTSCVRVQATPPQITLEKRRRLSNLKGAFEIRGNISCHHLVLLDDVVTTGATVTELAKLLKKHGAKRVDVWALARTP